MIELELGQVLLSLKYAKKWIESQPEKQGKLRAILGLEEVIEWVEHIEKRR